MQSRERDSKRQLAGVRDGILRQASLTVKYKPCQKRSLWAGLSRYGRVQAIAIDDVHVVEACFPSWQVILHSRILLFPNYIEHGERYR